MTVVRIVKKVRYDVDSTGRPHREEWREVEEVPDELSEEAMEEIWHEDGVDLEEHGVDVKSGDSSSTSGDSE